MAWVSTLDRSGGEAADEVPLQREEDEQWQCHGNEGAGRQKMPRLASGAVQVVQRQRDHSHTLLTAEEDQGDQKVVPDPEELEYGKRSEHRYRERHDQLGEDLEVGRPIDASRLHHRRRQRPDVVAQQVDRQRQAEPRVGHPHRRERAHEVEVGEQGHRSEVGAGGEQAQDRANDALRVNASELRVRVIGEGGNLGLTQAARVEFAAAGGRINTDAIDNSGGVHSSDREVNIKIPLNQLMAEGALSRAERDALLISMTDEVAQAVLEDNAQQSACVSLMALDAGRWVDEHLGLMHALEREGELDRALEGLPSDDQVQQRRAKGGGLLRPELSVLAAYAKNALFGVALESGLAADRFFAERLLRYFPAPMTARFAASIAAHRLGPEIVATSCANQVVNRMGAGFVQQMALDQSLAPAVVLKAFFAAQAVMDADACWQAVEAMQGRCPMAALYRCKWLLRDGLAQISAALSTRLGEQGIGRCVAHYSPLMAAFVESLPDGLPPAYRQRYDQQLEALAAESLPDHLAHLGARMQLLGCLPDIADLAEAGGVWLDGALWVYFELGQCLRMPWLQAAIARLPADNRWRVLARARLRQDLGRLHRQIAARVLKAADTSPEQRLSRWKSTVEDRLTRSRTCLSELQAADAWDFAGMSVALRALEDLARS